MREIDRPARSVDGSPHGEASHSASRAGGTQPADRTVGRGQTLIRNVVPGIILLAIAVMLVLGVYLFPMIKAAVNYQDCVASGRIDCARD